MYAASLLLSLLSVALAIGQAAGEQSSSISISSPPLPLLTKYEQDEHDLVWKVMNKACFGKWTGALQCFRMNKATNSPIISDDEELLNPHHGQDKRYWYLESVEFAAQGR